jgi:hypothetical protein
MRAVLFVIALSLGELALIFGTFSCGGAPFTLLGPDPTVSEAGPGDSPPMPPDAPASDASEEAKADGPLKIPRPDAGTEASIEAATEASSIPEASTEAEAEAAPVCTPIAPYYFACGTNLATTTAPGEFCLAINAGTSVSGMPTPMPSGCRCKETYTCACLLAAIADPCQGRSLQGCGVGNGPALRVDCR